MRKIVTLCYLVFFLIITATISGCLVAKKQLDAEKVLAAHYQGQIDKYMSIADSLEAKANACQINVGALERQVASADQKNAEMEERMENTKEREEKLQQIVSENEQMRNTLQNLGQSQKRIKLRTVFVDSSKGKTSLYEPDYTKAFKLLYTSNIDHVKELTVNAPPRKLTIGVTLNNTEDSLVIDMVETTYSGYDSITPKVIQKAISVSQLCNEITQIQPEVTSADGGLKISCSSPTNCNVPTSTNGKDRIVWTWDISSNTPGQHVIQAILNCTRSTQNATDITKRYKIIDTIITVKDVSAWSKFITQLPDYILSKIFYVISFLLGLGGQWAWSKFKPETQASVA